MWIFIKYLFHAIFYRPLLNGLLFLTSILPFHDLGFAIILLTIIIRLMMFPLTHKTLRTQHIMKKLEPEIKKIKEGNKSREEEARATMELYKAHGINPFSGFLALFIQFPLLIALYQVFWKGLPFSKEDIYKFLPIPTYINTHFLGFIPLDKGSIGMAALAALSQYWQARLAMPPKSNTLSQQKSDPAALMQKQMLYMFPVLIFILGFRLPAAVSLYWTAMNIFAIVHEAIVRKSSQHGSGN